MEAHGVRVSTHGHADDCTGDIMSPSELSRMQVAVLSKLLQAARQAAMTVGCQDLQRIPVSCGAEKLSERLTENNTSMEGRLRVASGSGALRCLCRVMHLGQGTETKEEIDSEHEIRGNNNWMAK